MLRVATAEDPPAIEPIELVLSIWNKNESEAIEVLPDESVAVIVTDLEPLERAVEGVNDQSPDPFARD